MVPNVAVTKSRVIFSGELEELLLKDPQKILRANPNLLKTKNSDIPLFIKTHFPNGL